MTVAFYLRVSTRDQTTDNQLKDLQTVARIRKWKVRVYKDVVSGAKGREARPEFDRLCKDVTRGKVRTVAAWSVDRLGRSLSDLVQFLDLLNRSSVDLYLHRQGVDTSTIGGRALFQMLGVFAEFERGIIRERIMAGIARARTEGKHFGRQGYPTEMVKQARALRRRGNTVREIMQKMSVGSSFVQRAIN